jgi:hypothetical protein
MGNPDEKHCVSNTGNSRFTVQKAHGNRTDTTSIERGREKLGEEGEKRKI